MKLNQYAILPFSDQSIIEMQNVHVLPHELVHLSAKECYEAFLLSTFPEIPNESSKYYKFKSFRANERLDLSEFLTQNKEISLSVFYQVALQQLEFLETVDYKVEDIFAFLKEANIAFITVKDELALTKEEVLEAIYLLLQTHTKNGVHFLDALIAKGLLKNNQNGKTLLFAGKSVATFSTNDLIREVVYVETDVDTDEDGRKDLVKVQIIRPHATQKIPALFTASPYSQGVNHEASDKKNHEVTIPFAHKTSNIVDIEELRYDASKKSEVIRSKKHQEAKNRAVNGQSDVAFESFINEQSYSLNDYFLSRGFASVYSAGIGGLESDGIQTCGSIEQTHGFQCVVEWLNGTRRAFTNKTDGITIAATWCNQNVAMTGISYLGTMATAVATTGVMGLKTVVSEAGISSWYRYYRENGLVIAPGGYPGEDCDALAEFTYSRMKQNGDYMHQKAFFDAKQKELAQLQDRTSGNYSTFWDERNYLNHVSNVKCDMIMVHGLNDWNVKPVHVKSLWDALKTQDVSKKIILHQGQHIYINNSRSLDYTDMMNLWFTHKLYDVDNHAKEILPNVLWQKNTQQESWEELGDFGSRHYRTYQMKDNGILEEGAIEKSIIEEKTFKDDLEEADFESYKKTPSKFKTDIQSATGEKLAKNRLYFETASIEESIRINGAAKITLKIKASRDFGFVSCRLLDVGSAKRLLENTTMLLPKGIELGYHFKKEDVKEFTVSKTPTDNKMISIGHINLQNRSNEWSTDELNADEYVYVTLDLQPSVYELPKGHKLGIVVYATDFEFTNRSNQKNKYTLDLSQCMVSLPVDKN